MKYLLLICALALSGCDDRGRDIRRELQATVTNGPATMAQIVAIMGRPGTVRTVEGNEEWEYTFSRDLETNLLYPAETKPKRGRVNMLIHVEFSSDKVSSYMSDWPGLIARAEEP